MIKEETGAELFARLIRTDFSNNYSNNNNEDDIFRHLLPSSFIEFFGISNSGKTQYITHLIASIILPTTCILKNNGFLEEGRSNADYLDGVLMNGLISEVVLIDTDHEFNLIRLISVLESRIKEKVAPFISANQNYNELSERCIEQSLNRFHICSCRKITDILATFYEIELSFLSRNKVNFIFLDMAASFHLTHNFNDTAKKDMDCLYTTLKYLATTYNIVVCCTRTDYQSNIINSAYNIINPTCRFKTRMYSSYNLRKALAEKNYCGYRDSTKKLLEEEKGQLSSNKKKKIIINPKIGCLEENEPGMIVGNEKKFKYDDNSSNPNERFNNEEVAGNSFNKEEAGNRFNKEEARNSFNKEEAGNRFNKEEAGNSFNKEEAGNSFNSGPIENNNIFNNEVASTFNNELKNNNNNDDDIKIDKKLGVNGFIRISTGGKKNSEPLDISENTDATRESPILIKNMDSLKYKIVTPINITLQQNNCSSDKQEDDELKNKKINVTPINSNITVQQNSRSFDKLEDEELKNKKMMRMMIEKNGTILKIIDKKFKFSLDGDVAKRRKWKEKVYTITVFNNEGGGVGEELEKINFLIKDTGCISI